MTKVQAIKKAMEKADGPLTLQQIYQQAKKYKRDIDQSADWQAGIRGVLYREIRNGKSFKKVTEATYGLI